MNGFSITLCFGSYAGFHARMNSWEIRVCLGWVALTIYPRNDIEDVIAHLQEQRDTAHEEGRKEVLKSTGFLRQYINQDLVKDGDFITDEQIQSFLKIGLSNQNLYGTSYL